MARGKGGMVITCSTASIQKVAVTSVLSAFRSRKPMLSVPPPMIGDAGVVDTVIRVPPVMVNEVLWC